ncbi:MAG: sulfotransferase domain-containing protein [Methylophaga sp.]|nr:sulfotransferase domain-containing protein [Methylophaga sp.]
MTIRKPDFIIIGAMKSATSTLHEQLALQPDFFMSNPKEPYYFSDDEIFSKGRDWYLSLFSNAAPQQLCGESSTHYTKLPDYPETISRMKAELPSVKLIYVLRHPVERLVSHYIHQWSQNVISCDINTAIARYDELINYSRYAYQIQPYIEAYGRDNILFVFNEALRVRPQAELERVAAFLGVDPSKVKWQTISEQNVSSERVRKFKGYHLLIESAPMTWLRRVLIPKGFREWVRKNLTMKKKPDISEDNRVELERIFDADLKVLSQILEQDFTTATFKDSALGYASKKSHN